MNTSIVSQNPWNALREFTAARIALGRTGVSQPTAASLSFLLDHARAKDAVLDAFHAETIASRAYDLTGCASILLSSAAADRREYLMRPDLGRKLSDHSAVVMHNINAARYDLSITIADGLSARAIHENAEPFLSEFLPLVGDLKLAPVSIVTNGRVAVADEIAFSLNAAVAVILIGERPGLKSPNSMGIYMTYEAKPGTTDERRNCISNVRPEGMPHNAAAGKLAWLLRESLRRKLSGVNLKDEQTLNGLSGTSSEAELSAS
jgi:ethanolamine ammonia-lyase small subunit